VTKFVIKAAVKSITSDSRKVKAGGLFLAYPGEKSDGREYIPDAIEKGASAILWDSADFSWNPEWQVENISINKLRLQAGNIASQFYRRPSYGMWMIGVTGTNGKTSISHWLSQCFNYLNRKAAVVGTLGCGFPKALTQTSNTTPDAILLQGMLASYVAAGAQVVAMEVSSHGLHQGRVNGVKFDVAVLSNLTHDHLDYHGTIEEYAAAKRRLFDANELKMAVVNCDDAFGQEIEDDLKYAGKPVLTYGIAHGNVRASNIVFESTHFSFLAKTPQGEAEVKANLIGKFNVYNVLAVLATLLVSKVSLKDAVEAIAHIESAAGRMQQLGGGENPLIVVDYAHTPDALEKVLSTLNDQKTQGSKLVCVFGCGGNRDASKRKIMGKIATKHADVTVVTSDNPRYENPKKIIHEILQGMKGNFLVEEDRAKAISVAISAAKSGDIVLIAGKGHEDYQEVFGIKQYFSDVDQAKLILKQYRGKKK
jgi:UDP-N-acetylmuramoyl-L-alanyl-D-glutamate--2,6-diaminopimelate ligase